MLPADLLQVATLALATTGEDGEPHVAPVYFAAGPDPGARLVSALGEQPGLRLYFFSAAGSQHGLDLARDPRAAGAIYPAVEDWRQIRGLQLRGEARPVGRGPEWDRAWKIYQGRFPFVAGLKLVVAQNELFMFVPAWIRLVDNSRRFGYKEEWVRAAGA